MRVLRLIREMLTGSEREFTSGPIGEAIFLLAVPMVAEMAMESLFAIVDVYFVSRLGSGPIAVVGLTESMLTLLYAVAIGLAMATTATVARRVGEGDRAAAATAGGQALLVALAIALAIGLPGAFLGETLLGWMGLAPDQAAKGAGYASVMLGGNATILLLFVGNAILRGAGDAAAAMRVLWLANGLNIVLDPCLIFGLGPFPELGVTGAAVATNIGRGTGVLYLLWTLLGGRGRLHLRLDGLRPHWDVAGKLVKLSLGGIGQFLVATGSWLALVRLLSRFGSDVVAGYTIAIRVVVFTILPAWGLSNAAATLMGQNLGARQPDRAARSVWLAALYNTLFLLAVAAFFLLGGRALAGNFTADPEVLASAVSCLTIVALGYPFYGVGMVLVQAFNGAGDTATPTRINLLCYWLLQIPLAFSLSRIPSLGATGVFIAIPIAEALLTLVSIWAFRRGGWRMREV